LSEHTVEFRGRCHFLYLYNCEPWNTICWHSGDLDIDTEAVCIFSGGLPVRANVTSTKIHCLAVVPIHGRPGAANISVRFLPNKPFIEVPTGLQFRFEHVPTIDSLHPVAVWAGKAVQAIGSGFDTSLPMHCRFTNSAGSSEVVADVETSEKLICIVPASLSEGLAALSVTVNHVEWSKPVPMHVYNSIPIKVIPEPEYVSGYGNERVHMSIFAPAGGPCEDDESNLCLVRFLVQYNNAQRTRRTAREVYGFDGNDDPKGDNIVHDDDDNFQGPNDLGTCKAICCELSVSMHFLFGEV